MKEWYNGTEDAYKELAFAVVMQAVKDYQTSARLLAQLITGVQIYDQLDLVTLNKAKRENAKMKDLKKWFLSDYCQYLLQDVVSADRILTELNKYEINYRKELNQTWQENQSRRCRNTRPSAAGRAKGWHTPRRKAIKRLQYRRQSAGARLPKNLRPRRVNYGKSRKNRES